MIPKKFNSNTYVLLSTKELYPFISNITIVNCSTVFWKNLGLNQDNADELDDLIIEIITIMREGRRILTFIEKFFMWRLRRRMNLLLLRS